MSKRIQIAAALCGAFIIGTTMSVSAKAETVTRTRVGPNGGSVHYRGDGVPGHYRGAVTVTTPNGTVYRRVTKVNRGPYGTPVSRRWVGPNGAAFAGARVPYGVLRRSVPLSPLPPAAPRGPPHENAAGSFVAMQA
jgi:hypothetical protein